MLKKTSLIIATIMLMSGCTREVYLQAVPCEENCRPCTSYTDNCPELEMQTITVQYQVYDVPARVEKSKPCNGTVTRKCRTTCQQTQVH